MRRLTSFVLGLAAAATMSGNAQAAALLFEQIAQDPGSADPTCPAPCFEIHMFLQAEASVLLGTPPTPEPLVELQSIQFDIDIFDGGVPALLPVPPDTNANAEDGNTLFRFRPIGGTTNVTRDIPWTLSSTVGKSPTAGFDALVVHAAPLPFTAESLRMNMLVPNVATPTCLDGSAAGVGALCDLVAERIALHQIYLGRFNATITGTGIRIAGLTGDGPLIDTYEGSTGECRFLDGSCRIPLPEPGAAVLLGALLAGLGIVRRQS